MHVDHFIWSTYGNWIPNCPRETWPRYMHRWEQARTGLRLLDENGQAQSPENAPYRINRIAAEKNRRFPPVCITPLQAQAISQGFERSIRLRHTWVWACCIMPEYVQLLITSPYASASLVSSSMRSEATKRLAELDLHPMQSHVGPDGQMPLMWSHVKWHLTLKDDASIHQAIEYVQGLPEREGAADQHWGFTSQFQSLSRCREESEAYECSAMAG